MRLYQYNLQLNLNCSLKFLNYFRLAKYSITNIISIFFYFPKKQICNFQTQQYTFLAHATSDVSPHESRLSAKQRKYGRLSHGQYHVKNWHAKCYKKCNSINSSGCPRYLPPFPDEDGRSFLFILLAFFTSVPYR